MDAMDIITKIANALPYLFNRMHEYGPPHEVEDRVDDVFLKLTPWNDGFSLRMWEGEEIPRKRSAIWYNSISRKLTEQQLQDIAKQTYAKMCDSKNGHLLIVKDSENV